MRYSDDIIEEVRSRNDIVDVVGMYVHLTKKGNNHWGLCPFHGEKTASFSVAGNKQMYYCFGCHKGGNVISFVMDYENLSFFEAVKILADRAGVNLPEAEYSEEEKKAQSFNQRLLEVNKLAAGYFVNARKSERGKLADNYFKKRGLDDETIRHWGLGYSLPYSDDLYKFFKEKGYKDDFLKDTGLFTFSEKGVNDKFWNRAMFPIMDERDRVIAFGGRVMGDGEPKYLNSPETKVFDKSNNLYGLNYAKLSRKDYFLLCEGYMDVISLHKAGFTNAVASLGTALTDKHVQKISRYVKEVYLTYDSDGAGTKAALRAIPMLESRDITVKVINMKPYKDPDEFIKALGTEEYQKRIDNAESSFFFELRIMASGYNMDDPNEKEKFYKSVARRLLQIEGDLSRKTYEEAFVKHYNIEYKPFHDLLVAVARSEGAKKPRYEAPDPEREYERKEFNSKEEKQLDEKVLKPQRLLLTYLSDNPKLFEKVRKVLSPAEFSDALYIKLAEAAFRELSESGTLTAARIINYFEEPEERDKVGMIFQTELPGSLNENEYLKAVEDTIRKIKTASLEKRMADAMSRGDSNEVNRLMVEQIAMKNRKTKLL